MGAIWRQLLAIALGGAYAFSTSCAIAQQITPDRTLPNNSNVTINGSTFNITGGTQAGRNLFHSFQQFSVPTGGIASFNNGLDIQNIISRVTGGSASSIDGLIKASGTANLFFLNPSGIVFGKNASLNIGGSFVATTANAIQFGNLGTFSATVPNNPALLTINPSALLYNQIAAAPIQNDSMTPAGKDPIGRDTFGLRVPDGKSLLLVGGNVNMDGGQLNAYSGRVELAGVAGAGTVGVDVDGNNLRLNFPDSVARADISLTQGSQVKVSGDGSGSIAVNAQNLDFSGGSFLSAGALPGSVGTKAGDVVINATGLVHFTDSSIINNDAPSGGKGGNIYINTRSLAFNKALLSTISFGEGSPGDISIQAHDTITIDNSRFYSDLYRQGKSGNISIEAGAISLTNSSIFNSTLGQGNGGIISIQAHDALTIKDSTITSSASSPSVGNGGDISIQTNSLLIEGSKSRIASNITPQATGNGGNINIQAKSLSLSDGAQIITNTLGQGNAGNININASDFVNLSGVAPLVINGYSDSSGGNSTGLITSTEKGANGQGGKISVNTGVLHVADGAILSTRSNSTFKGGEINISANKLEVTTGGQILSNALNSGDAGNINVKVDEGITLSGSDPTFNARNQLANFFNQQIVQDLPQQIQLEQQFLAKIGFSQEEIQAGLPIFVASALGRQITLDNISPASGLFVSSRGSGKGGSLNVQAHSLSLDNGASVSAATNSAEGGNITLNIPSLLLMRRNSQISASAGTQGGGGNGGNININAPLGFVVATKDENNDITANAFNGSGGVIKINALGIYNFNQRSLQDLEKLLGTDNPIKLEPQQLSTNDITAISLTSPALSGQVNIITPDIDPSRGLVALPTVTEVAPRLVSSNCAAFNEIAGGSSFTITGRGGLPPSPDEPLTSDVVWSDTRLPTTTTQHQHKTHEAKPKPKPIAIIPATGWVFNGKGEVTLISTATNATASNTPFSCPAR